MIWIKRQSTKSGGLGRGGDIALRSIFGFNDTHSSMFGTVFILHILQKGLLVLGSIRSLVLRMNIHRLVPLPKWSQLPETIKYICRNEKRTGLWSDFSRIFHQLLARTVHGEVEVFLPLWLVFSQSLHNAIHLIEHVIVDTDDGMQSNGMPFHHPQGPVSERP